MNWCVCCRLGKDTLHEQLIQLVCGFDFIWFHYRPLHTSVISDKLRKPWASWTVFLYNIKLLWHFYLWSQGKAPYHFRINIKSVKTQMETHVCENVHTEFILSSCYGFHQAVSKLDTESIQWLLRRALCDAHWLHHRSWTGSRGLRVMFIPLRFPFWYREETESLANCREQ